MEDLPPRDDLVCVIGAGVAGLSCARALADGGRRVVILDRARGVGGRCATRRIAVDGAAGAGQPVDFGVAFLHGHEPELLAALDAVPATRLDGWPVEIHGAGRPCQPEAFAWNERRLAFAEGVSAFPKHLGRGLDVRTGKKVTGLCAEGAALAVGVLGGEPVVAATVVLALASDQAGALLAGFPGGDPALATASALLGLGRSEPCLALIAAYPRDGRAPPWHVHYPEDSRVIQLVSHDSSKRPGAPLTVLVLQAHPRWSREHLGDERWPQAMLAEAGRLLGGWARSPVHAEPHRWRFARTDRGAELSAPILFRLSRGARLGLAGELFAPGGGAQAAWMSGLTLARQILAEVDG